MKTEQDLIPHYDGNPDYWSPVNRENIDLILSGLDLPVSSKDGILDIGCGDGRLCLLMYEKFGCACDGVDYSEVRIQKGRKRSSSNVWIHLFCDDVNSFWVNQYYTYGFMFEVLEHLEQPREVLDRYRPYCEVIAGSVPLNMPYKAHLQVFESVADVEDRLGVQVKFVRTYDKANLAFWRTS